MSNNTHRIPGYVTKDHRFEVPLNHAKPQSGSIEVFAREVTTPDNEKRDLPWLVFLQGGPGFGSPRPRADSNGVLTRAIKEYRVLLLDQRGTGVSSRMSFETLAAVGSPREQAHYLSYFRADSIVKDCELIRKKLIGKKKWSLLGQSFGGFVATTYLSFAPDALESVMITGGVPPVGLTAEDVYRKTYPRVLEKNSIFYRRYPDDIERIHRIVDYLKRNKVMMPNGDRLTVNRFRQLGHSFGSSAGMDSLHYLVEGAFDRQGKKDAISYSFRHSLGNATGFDVAPIYALLHEPCYCDANKSNWAADRVLGEFDAFEITTKNPVQFFGEMIYRWMFDEYKTLKPLKQAADLLARKEDWPALYDAKALSKNSVPIAAAMYFDDMYVDRELFEGTARGIPGIKLWVTNQFEHCGLRSAGDEVVGTLIDLLKGNKEFHYSAAP